MAIRLERIHGTASIARVYDEADPAPMANFCASFVAEWDGPRELWIKALQGRMTRRTLRELVTLLVEMGVHTVLARRAEQHVLPLGVVGDDGVTRIRVSDLAARFAKRGASDWIDFEDEQRGGP